MTQISRPSEIELQKADGHLERIRRAELESVRNEFAPGMQVLEIGGGSGFQAAILASWGCDVTAIDVAGRKPPHQIYYPVRDYDGKSLPFPDQSFDIVFSSNVLEHVPEVSTLLPEIGRVLKPRGSTLHILPSPSWRFWTSLTHYIYAFRWLFGIQPRVPGTVEPVPVREVAKQNGLSSVLKQLLLAGAHGEYPNAASELYYFSRKRWIQVFKEAGFRVTAIKDCGVFHTGYAILPGVTIETRIRIAAWLGSSCFVLTARQ